MDHMSWGRQEEENESKVRVREVVQHGMEGMGVGGGDGDVSLTHQDYFSYGSSLSPQQISVLRLHLH